MSHRDGIPWDTEDTQTRVSHRFSLCLCVSVVKGFQFLYAHGGASRRFDKMRSNCCA